ncbi:mitochondrial carrier domain-containing protein [Pseudomassariella vexata]|uniref:Mitochondrial carrier domain-containing protein n=1 Tax=Pseudomassariella vexata TaxID=1141098 RepID=A0A1Y2EJI5_9PEZI|nr:mitochondrial carrier domain-containing protein [Pseudomassariella vexata]ORY71729.1 mitochondrial carrier domain-containing protein [Pseudomassariella vexata]
MPDNDAGLSPALVETVAGLSAGLIATLVVHPLDIVKTRMQLHSSRAPTSASLTTIKLIRNLVQTSHPAGALYRGLTPNLLGNASSWASFFFFKARIEGTLMELKATQHVNDGKDASNVTAALTPTDYFVASGLAGVGVQILTNPVWVLKTRMLSSDRGAAGAYPSMWAGAMQLLRTEGWRGFYRGLGISLFGVSHGAVQFAVYEPAKKMYYERRRWRVEREKEQEGREVDGDGSLSMTNEGTLVVSSVSKLAAGAVTYPYQVIRSRLQNYNAEERFGKGIQGVVRRTWTEEGWRGFYRGIVPGVIRVLPATWVTFLVYENVKFYLSRQVD